MLRRRTVSRGVRSTNYGFLPLSFGGADGSSPAFDPCECSTAGDAAVAGVAKVAGVPGPPGEAGVAGVAGDFS